jgi:hypothetical protein
MKAVIDINKESGADDEIQQVRIRIKLATGREITVVTNTNDLARSLLGCSEIAVEVVTRNCDINLK